MFDARFIENPYPQYAEWRRQGRLVWTDAVPGGAWLVTRYADVSEALKDPRLSVKRSGRIVGQFAPEHQAELRAFEENFGRWMLFQNPPEHTPLRKLMAPAFRPEALEPLLAKIRSMVDGLFDAAGSGPIDFLNDIAHPLPALVIAEMLGIDGRDHERFVRWSNDIAAFFGNAQSSLEVAYAAQDSLMALAAYFRELLPERRRVPGEDLISLLARGEGPHGPMTEKDLVAQCTMLLFAGLETTRNLLGNGLFTLLSHRPQWELLRSEPGLMGNALRELLRYESPVQCTARATAADIDLFGQRIRAGQPVILLIGSANRDEAVFPDPDTFDIRRKAPAHLSFGAGPHVCIGAALTYMQAGAAFTAALERMANARLTAPPAWQPNFGFRGLTGLRLAV